MNITRRIIETKPDGTVVETVEYGPPESSLANYGFPSQRSIDHYTREQHRELCPYGPGRLAPSYGRHCNCPECY